MDKNYFVKTSGYYHGTLDGQTAAWVADVSQAVPFTLEKALRIREVDLDYFPQDEICIIDKETNMTTIFSTNGSVTVNGVTYKGNNISIKNGKVIIDGKTVSEETQLTINVEGNVTDLQMGSGDLNIQGNVDGKVAVDSGNIQIGGNVIGNVKSNCGNITVHGTVGGNVKTDCGNISHRK